MMLLMVGIQKEKHKEFRVSPDLLLKYNKKQRNIWNIITCGILVMDIDCQVCFSHISSIAICQAFRKAIFHCGAMIYYNFKLVNLSIINLRTLLIWTLGFYSKSGILNIVTKYLNQCLNNKIPMRVSTKLV